jgi:hypothetical protein
MIFIEKCLFLLISAFFVLSCKERTLEMSVINKSEISTIVGDDNNVKIIMPIQWINKLFEFDNYNNPNNLANEFVDIIIPYNIMDERYTTQLDRFRDEENMPWYITCMIVNIDEEYEPEIIALFGLPWEIYQVLLVFKKLEEDWYLLYYEPFYMHYNPPELCIANNYSKNKTFFIRQLYHRGTGIFQDAYQFYKLIDGKVYLCLTLLNESRIHGWGLTLNQDINSRFKFYGTNSDELWVTYNYHFFPGPIFEEDVDWNSHTEISFVKGEKSTKYIWDNEKKEYITSDLTEEKISCFWNFGNDELFIKSFGYEINKTLEEGTEEEKKILKWYIEGIKE